jgi:hypothetical protein
MASSEGWTWVPEEEAPAGWQPVDVSRVAPPGGALPFQVYSNRFKSSSPECELFIHDPLAAMLKDQVDGVRADSRVTTIVINHDRTLSRVHLIVLALVAADIVILTLFKVAP